MLSTRHRVAPTLHPNNHEFRARYSMATETRAVVVGKLQTTGLTTWEVMEEWAHTNVNSEGARRASRWIVDQANVRCNLTFEDVGFWITAFSVFAEDVRILALPKGADDTIATLISIAFGWFLLEIVLLAVAKTTVTWTDKLPRFDGYLLGFYFWLDVLAAMSMLLYIPIVAQDMGVDDPHEFAAGTEVSFLRRVGRAIRLARLFAYMNNLKGRREEVRRRRRLLTLAEQAADGTVDGDELVERAQKLKRRRQSRICALLTESIARKVILIVLILFSFAPQLVFSEDNTIEQAAARSLHKYSSPGDELAFNVTYSEMLKQFDTFSSGDQRLLYVYANPTYGVLLDKGDARRRLRMNEREIFEYSTTRADSVTYHTKVVFSKRPQVEHEAVLGICLTVVVSILLLGSVSSLTSEAQHLVLNPIERMMALVEQLVQNPLAAIDHPRSKAAKGNHSEFETSLLESTIRTITDLLRVSFGEAGAGIISQNLSLKEGGDAVINPLVAGKRVYAIFAFTDIRDFDRVTELLDNKVMQFVNSVAEIVHSTAGSWGGQSNKNLGNAFLMVWRIGDDNDIFTVTDKASVARKRSASAGTFLDMWEMNRTTRQAPSTKPALLAKSDSVKLERVPGSDVLAEKALIAFLKIQIRLNRSKHSEDVRRELSEKLSEKLGRQRFMIRMGVGIHAGWAIEGAVGSMQKVDATYLSPHVNLAARMQTATKQYGVSILMTEDVVQLMSTTAQEVCRMIDRVTVKGSKDPKAIYTYDCNPEVRLSTTRAGKGKMGNRDAEALAHYSSELWHSDPELVALRSHAAGPFASTFKNVRFTATQSARWRAWTRSAQHALRMTQSCPTQAVKQYIAGNWEDAKFIFEAASTQYEKLNGKGAKDRPTEVLMQFMQSKSFKKPDNWAKCRELTSK